MPAKPSRAAGYTADQVEHVRATCLYIATTLGDLTAETVVGGLVPSLLIDQTHLAADDQRHVGTLDLDVGLALAILDDRRYQALTERLRRAGFRHDTNDDGKPTRQRWKIHGPPTVTVDFLIPPSTPASRPGTLQNIESDFAAVVVPGLQLAFEDQQRVRLVGKTITGEVAEREVGVAGPGAYVVLKALALKNRGENKDAYDLFYLLRHFGAGLDDAATRVARLLHHSEAREALDVLEANFADLDGVGPRRVAEFLRGGSDDELQADARGLALDLVARCRALVREPSGGGAGTR